MIMQIISLSIVRVDGCLDSLFTPVHNMLLKTTLSNAMFVLNMTQENTCMIFGRITCSGMQHILK